MICNLYKPHFQEVLKLQNKSIRIISFLPFNSSNINKTYNDLKILKLSDFISLQNSLFVKDYFEKELLSPFINYFQKSVSRHRTCSAFKNCAFILKVNTDIYGEKFIKYQCINTWKKYQKQFKIDLLNRRRADVMKLLNRKPFEIILREIIFQHPILSSPSLSFTLFLFSSFTSLSPYSLFLTYSPPSINPSPL